jgi:hypothetical protein
MKMQMDRGAGIPGQCLALIPARIAFVSLPVHACTIFVLTDTNGALFCSNQVLVHRMEGLVSVGVPNQAASVDAPIAPLLPLLGCQRRS